MEEEEEGGGPQPKHHHHHNPIHALTHILLHPTPTPSLHSQLLIATHLPPSYPPLRRSLPLLLRRPSTPRASWRSKCPFQLPSPPVLSSAVAPAPARWTSEARRSRFRERVRRPRLGVDVPPVVGLTVPNLVLFGLLLLWDPLSLRQEHPPAAG